MTKGLGRAARICKNGPASAPQTCDLYGADGIDGLVSEKALNHCQHRCRLLGLPRKVVVR